MKSPLPDDESGVPTDVDGRPGPLAGIRILELATVIMAPYGAQLLGDLGAEVTKIEHGPHDSSRIMGGGPHPELSGIALNLHRNKRSIALDVKSVEGRAVFRRLLGQHDVLITNLRPAPLQRLGIDYRRLAVDFPRLIYCQAQGFATGTSEADRPAYDDIIQAAAGMPPLNEPVVGRTAYLPSLMADKVAGLTIAYGVLAALVHRERTGAGQHVEVPMFDTALAFNLVEHIGQAATPGRPAGYSRVLTSHRGPHRTSDGYVALLPYTDEHWRLLCTAVERVDILERPWFENHRTRLAEADRVYGDLAEIVAMRSTREWLELAAQHGIPANEVPSLDEIVGDPARHRGVISEIDHDVVGAYRSIRPPVRLSATPASVRSDAPLVGEHSIQILTEAGYSPAEITALVEAGTVTPREALGSGPDEQ